MMMSKRDYAEAIESHHLYEPMMGGVYSKQCSRYDPDWEVRYLMRTYSEEELAEIYHEMYDNGRELHVIISW